MIVAKAYVVEPIPLKLIASDRICGTNLPRRKACDKRDFALRMSIQDDSG